MAATTPKSQIILGYRDLFNEDPPADRLSLLRGMDRNTVIGEITRLNYSLKPKDRMYQDTSFAKQKDELWIMCGQDPVLHAKFLHLLRPFKATDRDYPLLFTRQTCLFATEEIIQSDLAIIEGFGMTHSWAGIMKYLLAVNSSLTRVTDGDDEDSIESGDEQGPSVQTEGGEQGEGDVVMGTVSPFEDINRKMLVLNELSLDADPFCLAHRGYRLMEYMAGRAEIGAELVRYLDDMYGMGYPQFIYELMSMYFGNNKDGENNLPLESTGKMLDATFLYSPAPGAERMFETLSQVYASPFPARLTSIRKYPFHKTLVGFCLSDNIFMLEKGYNQFVNDFWFDRVKGLVDDQRRAIFPIKRYRAIFGGFVEDYMGKIIDFAFEGSRHFHVYKFDQLKIRVNNRLIEFSDIYIRNSDKIFLSEVKSTAIYDKEKYSGDLDGFYKDDREGFFNSFGMGQLINAIELLSAEAKQFDLGFPEKGTIRLYPSLVVNEKGLQTPTMAKVFNDYFQGTLPKEIDGRIKVQPLSIIHVSDFENMEDHLHDDPNDFFKIMKFHVREPSFIPPFYNTVRLKQAKKKPKRALKLIEELVRTYQRPVDE